MRDDKLWKQFSRYIRLRDADEYGYCSCITCGVRRHWTKIDCGHGISRRHMSTKYNEKNNHAQCKVCNGFEGGKRDVYKEEVDKRYGIGTWAKMEIQATKTKSISDKEIDVMANLYRSLADALEKKLPYENV